jgi:membrane protease YdiL (CAAX protease family)
MGMRILSGKAWRRRASPSSREAFHRFALTAGGWPLFAFSFLDSRQFVCFVGRKKSGHICPAVILRDVARFMKIRFRWPPSPLGLGTPLNLALVASSTRSLLLRGWWIPLLTGFGVAVLILLVDQALFAGASLERVREVGSQPLTIRFLIVVYSGIMEEVIYRLFLATLVAWVAYLVLRSFVSEPKQVAQWLGILVAAFFFGLAHVGNLPNIAHPVLRAVTINGILDVVLGWIYWTRGLESSILTHMVGIVVIYIGVPLIL